MSIPPNPLPPEEPQLAPEFASGPLSQPALEPRAVPASRRNEENPPWSLWDVLLLMTVAVVLMTIIFPAAAIFFFGIPHILGYHLHELFNNRGELDKFFEDPRVTLPVQLVGYVALLFVMAWIVRERTGKRRNFFQSLCWQWPRDVWPRFVLAGAVLAVLIQIVSVKLPIPHSLPIEKFFQTATYAYLTGAFSILVAPLMEELFFRGFLYPALARGFERITGLFFADPVYRQQLALSFAALVAAEAAMWMRGVRSGFLWAAVALMFLVPMALTTLRLRKQSVVAGVIFQSHQPRAQTVGIWTAIFFTAATFTLVHGAQLSFHWAALLPIFIVGLVLTLVRARTQSLAASVLIHISYNTTIFLTVFVFTGGFRHLERL